MPAGRRHWQRGGEERKPAGKLSGVGHSRRTAGGDALEPSNHTGYGRDQMHDNSGWDGLSPDSFQRAQHSVPRVSSRKEQKRRRAHVPRRHRALVSLARCHGSSSLLLVLSTLSTAVWEGPGLSRMCTSEVKSSLRPHTWCRCGVREEMGILWLKRYFI